MMWIYLLVGLTSSVCGMVVVNPTSHQTAETNSSSIISWDSQIKSDLSLANVACFLRSETLKVLYEMINGVEVSESQHQQFVGRVQLDRDALREGRVTIHLSNVTEQDSGNYWCELRDDYGKNTMRWSVLDTETFVVAQNKDGENDDESVSRFKPARAEGAKHSAGRRQHDVPRDSRSVAAPIILTVLIVGILFFGMLTSPPTRVSGEQQEEVTLTRSSMKDTWIKLFHVINSFLLQRIQQKKQHTHVLQV